MRPPRRIILIRAESKAHMHYPSLEWGKPRLCPQHIAQQLFASAHCKSRIILRNAHFMLQFTLCKAWTIEDLWYRKDLEIELSVPSIYRLETTLHTDSLRSSHDEVILMHTDTIEILVNVPIRSTDD